MLQSIQLTATNRSRAYPMRLIEMMDYCWSYFLDMLFYGPVAQLVRAPPCHGGGRRFESVPGR